MMGGWRQLPSLLGARWGCCWAPPPQGRLVQLCQGVCEILASGGASFSGAAFVVPPLFFAWPLGVRLVCCVAGWARGHLGSAKTTAGHPSRVLTELASSAFLAGADRGRVRLPAPGPPQRSIVLIARSDKMPPAFAGFVKTTSGMVPGLPLFWAPRAPELAFRGPAFS